MSKQQTTTNPAPHTRPTPDPSPNGDGARAWSDAALEQEMRQLASLPEENPNKPGSAFSICLLKIASIIKGDGKHIAPSQAVAMITAAVAGMGIKEKEIVRQWGRAYNKATPRYRSGDTAPAPAPAPPSTNGDGSKKEIDTKNPRTGDYMAGFERLEFKFRMNELDDSIELNEERMTDGLEAVVLNKMRDMGLASPSWVQRAYTQAAYRNQYHPVKEYFDSLKWDNKDWIGWFVDHYMEETTGLGKIALLRWFIGAVAKTYEAAQNFMLVLDGPQGVGKSTFARWLCPLPQYFIEGPINPEDKDAFVRLCTRLVWEVGELQATTRKSDREALKHFITTQEVTVRPAYARYDIVKPALASMVGTINEDGAGFLTDPTGSRRFIIIYVQSLNWDYISQVDVSNLWSQAVALYKTGRPWQLQPDERQLQNVVNARYEMDSILATLFFEHYDVDLTNPDAFETVADIMDTLELGGLRSNQQASINELARLMKKLGAEKFRAFVGGKRPSAYKHVVKVSDNADNEPPPVTF